VSAEGAHELHQLVLPNWLRTEFAAAGLERLRALLCQCIGSESDDRKEEEELQMQSDNGAASEVRRS
jgi:hypothetical protein